MDGAAMVKVRNQASSPEAKHRIAVGRLLREWRESAGLSQSELARRAGVARDTVTRVERGERGLSWYLVCRFADVLGMPIEALRPRSKSRKG